MKKACIVYKVERKKAILEVVVDIPDWFIFNDKQSEMELCIENIPENELLNMYEYKINLIDY